MDHSNHKSSPRILYFWDIENCSIPRGYSADEVVKNIRSILGPGKKELSFTCFMDVTQAAKELTKDLYFANVTMNHVPNYKSGAIDQKITLELMQLKEYCQHENTTVVLISGDIDFVQPLQRLKNDGFGVVVNEEYYGHQPSEEEKEVFESWESCYSNSASDASDYYSDGDGYECDYCDRVFGSERALEQHENDTGHYEE